VWAQHPAVLALIEHGHQVEVVGTSLDLILHPAAHGWADALFVECTRSNGTKYRPYVAAALAAARANKRGRK
jgi:hypothetical protein